MTWRIEWRGKAWPDLEDTLREQLGPAAPYTLLSHTAVLGESWDGLVLKAAWDSERGCVVAEVIQDTGKETK